MHFFLFDYPIYYLFVCLFIAFCYAYVLYKNERHIRSVNFIRCLFLFRFFFIGFISFLLLNPKYKSEISTKEKPIVIIAKDNSESIKNDITNELKSLAELIDEFEVYFYSFSDDIYTDINKKFDGLETNYSKFFSSIKNQFENRNIAALILASDGCYNAGLNPEYINFDFPVYSVALGDTNFYEDIRIDNVMNNEVAFFGNRFPIEISLASNLLQDETKRLIIELNDKVVFEKKINFLKGTDYQTHNIYLLANKLGIQNYSIKIEALNKEKNTLNNLYKLYVDIFDTKHKIVILKKNVSPDIAAYKSAVSSVENYHIDVFDVGDFVDSAQLNKYNLIVLFGLERVPNYILNSKIPLVIFDAKNTHYKQLKSGITFNSSEYVDLVNVNYDVNFNKFSVSNKLIDLINTAPPLLTTLGFYKFTSELDLFLTQKVNNLTTNKPVILFQQKNRKIVYVTSSNWWKWKIYDYKKNLNNEVFNELFAKLTQFLVINNEKSKFRIDFKNQYTEKEEVIFNAFLYNEIYELINSYDINVQIIDNEDKKYEFQFSKYEDAYSLNLGLLSPGKYNFIIDVNNSKYKKEGSFDVLDLNIEQIGPNTNHDLLYKISDLSGGNVFYPNEMQKISNNLNLNDKQSIIHYKLIISDLIDKSYLLFLILSIISAEWCIRKFCGII